MEIFEFVKDEPQTHVITTTNKTMNDIGLGAFTRTMIYEYFMQYDRETGEYINRDLIRLGNRPLEYQEDFYGFEAAEPYFSVFKLDGTNGYYEKTLLRDWSTEVNGDDGFSSTYTLDDVLPLLGIDFDVWFNTVIIHEPEPEDPIYVISEVNPNRWPSIGGRKDFGGPSSRDLLGSIVALNDVMIDIRNKLGSEVIKDPYDIIDPWPLLAAIFQLLRDIKTSKEGGIVWETALTFYLSLAGGQFVCPVRENIEFKLQLGDKPVKPRDKAAIVLKENLVSDFRSDETGRVFQDSTDGNLTALNPSDDSQKTVAPMKLNYNAYKNQWESGTTSLLAIVGSGGINAAPLSPSFQAFMDGDVDAIINSSSVQGKITFSTGVVMPIFMQNSNPYQWAPNYATDQNCDGSSVKTKQTLKGLNFNPNKSYEENDVVIISQIGGVWHVMDPGVGIVPPTPPGRSFYQWQFNSFMTHDAIFFRRNNGPRVSAPEILAHQHLTYYRYDPKNGGKYGSLSDEAGTNELGREWPDFDTRSLNPSGFSNCYTRSIQISSFDFMDSDLLGTRGIKLTNMDYNSINTTQGGLDAAGRTLPKGQETNPAHSGPFFGCVFPEGYKVPAVYTNFSEDTKTIPDFNIVPCGSGQDVYQNKNDPKVGPWFQASQGRIRMRWNETASDPAKDGSLIPYREIDDSPQPFRDPVTGINKRKGYGERSDVRSAVLQLPEEEFGVDGNFYRYWNFHQGPSMFYGLNHQGDNSLNQLPADIALNGSPKAEWGGPLVDLDIMRAFSYNIDKEEQTHGWGGRQKDATLLGSIWVKKQDKVYPPEDGDALVYKHEDSAFDFEPNAPNVIQFRPLKMELYALMNSGLWMESDADLKFFTNSNDLWEARNKKDLATPAIGQNYSLRRVDAQYTDFLDSLVVPDRGDKFDPDSRPLPPEWKEYDQQARRLSWSTSLARHTMTCYPPIDANWVRQRAKFTRPEVQNLPFLYEDYEDRELLNRWTSKGGRVHVRNYWGWEVGRGDFQWMGIGSDYGAASYGVTTASCRVSSADNITFSTNNYFGMRSARHVNQGGIFGGTTVVNTPSWGGSSVNSYRAPNTFHLAVSVYHAWPREQTIFDPVGFTVSHFNPKMSYTNLAPVHNINGVPQTDLSYNDLCTKGNYETYRDYYSESDDATGNFFYTSDFVSEIDYAGSTLFVTNDITKGSESHPQGVGIREPSYHLETTKTPIPVPEGASVFSDSQIKIGEEGDLIDMLPKSYWHLNATRVGKMLPYRYFYKTITFPQILYDKANIDLYENYNIIDLALYDLSETVEHLASTGYYALLDNGAAYKKGDLLREPVTGTVFEVMKVGEEIGEILEIRPRSQTDGPEVGPGPKNWFRVPVDSQNFLAADTRIDVDGQNYVKTIGITETLSSEFGEGFGLYFIAGQINTVVGTDQKPQNIVLHKQISANADDTGTTRDGTEFGIVDEKVDTVVSVAANPSANLAYDCFFHAHNDTSFVWFNAADGYYGDEQNKFEVDEQYITLTITS